MPPKKDAKGGKDNKGSGSKKGGGASGDDKGVFIHYISIIC